MDVEKVAYDLQQKYSKRMEKKMQGKPQAVKIIWCLSALSFRYPLWKFGWIL